ncbi:Helix-turn-helix domain-containing protein [Methylobacillus rhizosphaerae]|uniref:Helix-turn-helix domain-containing protein n=1 Tax=Methylobacillus rhizosphaerae TaxID=551994 RepID=A0A239B834_9PROT|nr:helix-turn-helix transcriptional regulator [Methylobacillus rhizosphaerae]SNS03313.1 Helix-turn-helix domain-containing protein [Methylobacillus rhizosphaerae]
MSLDIYTYIYVYAKSHCKYIYVYMSSAVGKKIRAIRENLGMGRQEFADTTGIPKGTLIGIEQDRHEPKAGVLEAIADHWPEYAAYLLTDNTSVKQRNPELEALAKELEDQKNAS